MTNHPEHGDFEREEGLPPELAEDLASLYRAGGVGHDALEPPSRVDEAVMAAARERFAATDRGGPAIRFNVFVRRIGLVGGPLAAAAVLALMVWLTPWRPNAPQGPVPMPGTGARQAKELMENEADERMLKGRLAFEEASSAERAESFAERDDAANAGASLASLADARRDKDEFARNAAGRAASPAAEPAHASRMLAAEATPAWLEDFNGDGVVDMRDALMMARVVERGDWTMDARWDLNGDGVVDEQDVRVVALAAVDLERHGEVLR